MKFLDLPNEIICEIFKYIPLAFIYKRVCKRFNNLIEKKPENIIIYTIIFDLLKRKEFEIVRLVINNFPKVEHPKENERKAFFWAKDCTYQIHTFYESM